MAKIRETSVGGNTGGRAACQFQSPFTNQIHYATVEHGWVVVRDYGKVERGRETIDPVRITPMTLSACLASPGMACVTVAGFHAGSDDSATETFVFPMAD